MDAFYFDSSALVKRYAQEKGTNFLIKLLRPSAAHFLYSAKITEVEVCSALSRRQKGLLLTENRKVRAILRFRSTFRRRFFTADLTDGVVDEAIRLAEKHALRGYDAIQLAAALIANRRRLDESLTSLIFVCADGELNNAAQSEGLTVDDPNNHP